MTNVKYLWRIGTVAHKSTDILALYPNYKLVVFRAAHDGVYIELELDGEVVEFDITATEFKEVLVTQTTLVEVPAHKERVKKLIH